MIKEKKMGEKKHQTKHQQMKWGFHSLSAIFEAPNSNAPKYLVLHI